MSGTVGKRGKSEVRIGPDLRKVKIPVILTAGTVILILDASRWHIVHHLIGAYSGVVVSLVIVIWLVWGIVKIRARRKKKA